MKRYLLLCIILLAVIAIGVTANYFSCSFLKYLSFVFATSFIGCNLTTKKRSGLCFPQGTKRKMIWATALLLLTTIFWILDKYIFN